jgi:hypothetical protein
MEAVASKVCEFTLRQSIFEFDKESGFSHTGLTHNPNDLA